MVFDTQFQASEYNRFIDLRIIKQLIMKNYFNFFLLLFAIGFSQNAPISFESDMDLPGLC
jgi:hypothetical protein